MKLQHKLHAYSGVAYNDSIAEVFAFKMLSFLFLHCFPFSSCHRSSIVNSVFPPVVSRCFVLFFCSLTRVSRKAFQFGSSPSLCPCFLYAAISSFLFFHFHTLFQLLLMFRKSLKRKIVVNPSHTYHIEKETIPGSMIILFIKAQLSKMCSLTKKKKKLNGRS